MNNIILNTDSYKASHYLQYPPGTEFVSSYIEARGGEYPETVFFGLQGFIKAYLLNPITQEDIDEAEAVLSAHAVPFNRAGWEYILQQHSGYLPVEIQALPEGCVVPTRNALVQIRNTDANVPWLTSYLETALLRAVWYPTTVATRSYACKQVIQRYLKETADSTDGLPFKLHDFGSRGATSEEAAAIGGAAHLVNFQGTDTLAGVLYARRYYQEPMAGFSIPAAEHSTITSWGRDGEQAAYANMVNQFAGPEKLVAVVSDSYDLWNAIDNLWGTELKDQVVNNGGTVVIRPDSGEPTEIVPEAIERLMAKFGHSLNSKGYRQLPDYIRLIQGDGVSVASIEAILEVLKQRKISADNLAFGMGGELLQRLDRDTCKFAMKASAAQVNGQWRDVFKDPITDPGKRSKRGRLAVVDGENGIETVQAKAIQTQQNLLRPVFENGVLLIEDSFADIRRRAEKIAH